MKTPMICPRMLLICALLHGMMDGLRADLTSPIVPAPPPTSRIVKNPGIFNRIFGRRAELVEVIDNDDVNDHPGVPLSQRPAPAPGTTIITRTTTITTTNREPPLPQKLGADARSRVKNGASRIAPPPEGLPYVSREVQPVPPPLESPVPPPDRYPRMQAPAHTVVVPSTAPPAPMQLPLPPPLSKNLAPAEVRTDAALQDQPARYVPPSATALVSRHEAPANLRISVSPPNSLPTSKSSSSLAERNLVSVP